MEVRLGVNLAISSATGRWEGLSLNLLHFGPHLASQQQGLYREFQPRNLPVHR